MFFGTSWWGWELIPRRGHGAPLLGRIGHLEGQLPPFLEGRRDERSFMWLLRRFIDPRSGGPGIVGKQESIVGDCFTGQPVEGWLRAWEWFWGWIRSNPPCQAPAPASRSVLNPDHRSCLPESAVAAEKLPRGVSESHQTPALKVPSQEIGSRDCVTLTNGADFMAGPVVVWDKG